MGIRARTETALLDAADELFFCGGIAGTPVDAVLARAGVSAATLYRWYPTKDALVASALDRRHRAWLAAWDEAISRAATPQDKLLAVFDALDEFRSGRQRSRWCAFLGSAAEYAHPPDQVGEAITRDSDTLRDRLHHLAVPVVGRRAPELAQALTLIVSGYLAMRLRDPDHDTRVARAIAATMVQNS
jgi:AcrR family transcriptional regulator